MRGQDSEINCLNCHGISRHWQIFNAKFISHNMNTMISTEWEMAEKIHAAAMALLDDPGIRLDHDGICRLLLRTGAKRGRSARDIRLPEALVREKLALSPSEFVFADRKGEGGKTGPETEAVIWSVPGMRIVEDQRERRFTSKDMASAARLLHQLEHVDGIFGLAMDDVPPGASDVVGLRIMAEHTSKHIRVLCFTPRGSEMLVEMKKVVGHHPWFSVGFTAHGPLRWTNLALEIFSKTAGHGIPVTVNGEPMAGVSGPATLAGSAAVGTAEILAGIVVNQLLEPGRPCVFNLGLAHTFDMRSSIAVTGGPENHLFAGISAMMGRYYGIPSASWVSTESMCSDAQAALEKMCGFLTHLQTGVSNIWGVGQLESELSFSPAQAVIDNEIISYVKRYLKGVDVNEDTLAVEQIREAGITGSFLDSFHTLEHFQDEFFQPEILNRSVRENWKTQGSRNLSQVAEEKAERLMGKEIDNGLDEHQVRELDTLATRFLKQITED
jgi:trimethylamine--corrinoid protein Co-methyltransferase